MDAELKPPAAATTGSPSKGVTQTTPHAVDNWEHPRVAIIEIGAGGNVTTVRLRAEQLLKRWRKQGAECTLIRINPELPLADDKENSKK